MNGLLIFFNDPKASLEQRISIAAQMHRRKFGCEPNAAQVHPGALPDGRRLIDGVLVRNGPTLVDHVLIGVDRSPEQLPLMEARHANLP